MTIQALLLSSSREGDSPYLQHTLPYIAPLTTGRRNWVFVPYAGISLGYDNYLTRVREGLASLNINISGIHEHSDPRQAIRDADGILVGGGNTFHLLHELYRYDLLHLIREEVAAGKPYIGWSAGSNVAGLSIRTTNDMPIIEPPSFTALGLLPFQLNPHYTDYQAPGHNGETRAQRLLEFTCVDPLTPVVGIQEGSALLREGDSLKLLGDKEGYLFKGEIQKQVIAAGSDLSAMLA
ncbi:dipeptidase PepE [Shewanella cyperi]|uniref:dipeptidase PepE n=1 Tax=Shewanella cyperi TaxID=2814292 RepID=UPI001A94FFEB|nr:dipeptidase PepE [Shewanella cyperi]QSX42145.1 dipeptidase PepE [Shewanella cyperi]